MATENSFKLSGAVTDLRVEQTKTGKTVVKLSVGVDPPAFMKNASIVNVPVTVFGRSAEQAKDLKVGQSVIVNGRLGGHEYNGRVYPDIIGDSFTVVDGGTVSAPTDDSTMPF